MKAKPLYDRVLIRRSEHTTKQTAAGIHIPDSAQERPYIGEVIACGDGRYTETGKPIPLNVTVGDTVLFGKYSCTEISLNGDSLLIMREDEILMIVENE